MDIFNNWVEEGARETGSWSWEEDLLKAVSGDPGLHHQPPMEEDLLKAVSGDPGL